ncbi:TTC7B [Cordylochernes scorpioides]|uniref:TTC7B n=1 Tax=Cordylochernes scorpioides TaxID=51811 RepID=A0ABY6KCK6_9ARAC|nr:TTC7B [Cordylochernes scorpioides]
MASKQKTAVKIEWEIEKSREESNWKKVQELAEQLTQKKTGFGQLVEKPVQGRNRLEQVDS